MDLKDKSRQIASNSHIIRNKRELLRKPSDLHCITHPVRGKNKGTAGGFVAPSPFSKDFRNLCQNLKVILRKNEHWPVQNN
mgnify:CR=1 FL=1